MGVKKRDQEEDLRKLQALLDDNREASGIFDSLPAIKGEEVELEEPVCGPDAEFPSIIEGVNRTEIVEQSNNGSRVIRAMSKLLSRKK